MRFRSIRYIIGIFFFLSCNTAGVKETPKTDTLAVPTTSNNDSVDAYKPDGEADYATKYLVIADTGQDYYVLQHEMYALSEHLHIPVDTMHRYYNKQKNEIVLAEDDEDEMYRGEYFPRRYDSVALSLEYYVAYNEVSTNSNIALVSGLFDARKNADSALAIMKGAAPHSFVLKAQVFMGCMH